MALALNAGLAAAATATYTATPGTFSVVGGCTAASVPACTVRAYQGCSVANQTVGALLGTVTAGTALPSFQGDTATPPVVCERAESANGNGTFAVAYRLDQLQPPGAITYTMTCVLTAAGGPCSATAVTQ